MFEARRLKCLMRVKKVAGWGLVVDARQEALCGEFQKPKIAVRDPLL